MKCNQLTRRDALKTGCATTAALIAPTVIPSSALGNQDTAPPSERVTLAHIGVGGRGSFLLNLTQQQGHGIQSVAVADCYKQRRDSAADLIEGKPYADFREILDRHDIDGVIIATPDHWHVPIAIMAARAGKSTYVEKPLGLTIEQTLLCRRVFLEEKRVFQYGTQQREAEHQKFGRQLVLDGKLGELKAIEVKAPDGDRGGSTDAIPVPPDFNYDMWLGPAPMVPYTADRCQPPGTYWIYDQSIGYLAGWGAHPLDIMVWCYQGDQTGPFSIEGTGVIPSDGLYNTVIHWDLTLTMADHVKITFRPGSDSTKFIGSEGSLELTRSSIRANPTELLDKKLPNNDHARNAASHIQEFADSIRNGEQTKSHIVDAMRSDIISHLCDIAVRTGEKLTWDPKQEQLVGGSEKAIGMLHRAMRSPWTL
ncbi:MAG: Gfo/Idh/MocA family oxidoreductase [Pirellulales bacterium]|nr:Gfo/Idh/MocA family oxidoreductase [Pirellulales bacterium]